MKTSKRFLTLLLALVMLVGVFTVSALAQDTTIEVRLEGEGSNASFSPDSDGKLTLPAYNDCIGWTCGGETFDVGAEIGYAEAASVATNGVAVFTPVYEEEEKPESVPSTPLQPALPTTPTGPKYSLSIDYYIDNDYYYGCTYGCKYECKHEYENWYDGTNHFGWFDTPWFDSSWDSDPRACSSHYSYQPTCYYCTNGKYTGTTSNVTGNSTLKLRGEGEYVAGQRVSISASSSFTYRGVKYYFSGWYGTGTFANRDKASTIYVMPSQNATIYATYSAYSYTTNYCTPNHTHTVTYTDGVSGQTVFKDVVKTVRHNGTTPTIQDPTRPGYRFVGWSPKVSKNTSKCTVYEAQWSKAVAPKLTSECVAYLKGYGKGEFRPENNMTRGEFAVLLYRLLDDATLKAYKTTENTFSDVKDSDWYNEAISTLANASVIENEKTYRPKENITRAEMVAMLAAFYDYKNDYDYSCDYGCYTKNSKSYYNSYNHSHNYSCYTNKYTTSYSCNYKDVPSTYWAYDAIAFAQSQGWVKGYGANTFLPDATITRAEVAAIINRVLDRDCSVKDTKNYTDVAKDAWYYADVLEATIAH